PHHGRSARPARLPSYLSYYSYLCYLSYLSYYSYPGYRQPPSYHCRQAAPARQLAVFSFLY
ncbi:MAG: hypothetical protein PUD39_08575, partial [Bacteroidales bacterium]|nr:hypothetical protein [Bacteroidales bacterium]